MKALCGCSVDEDDRDNSNDEICPSRMVNIVGEGGGDPYDGSSAQNFNNLKTHIKRAISQSHVRSEVYKLNHQNGIRDARQLKDWNTSEPFFCQENGN